MGQTVLEKQNLSGTNFSFNVASLSNGTYILQLQEGSNISRSKFVKKQTQIVLIGQLLDVSI